VGALSTTDTFAAVPLRARRRSLPHQFVRFAAVGASGYVVNLAVFAFALHVLDVHYQLAAVLGFLVAVTSNFLLNRHWTFVGHGGRRTHQAMRFLIVSVAAFLLGLALLSVLVGGFGVAEVPAQAISIVAATPLSFVANRLWTFPAR
jgi:dolichol-phosphate mannosyltransferase